MIPLDSEARWERAREHDAGMKSQLTDPLLAVSEFEQKVNDLVERLRNATIVISGQVDSIELLFDQQNSQNERLNSVEEHVERALFGIDRHEEVLDAQNHRLNSIESLLSTWTQK